MKKSNVLIYLILAVLFILLREPLYEMWNGWGPVARLSAIVPSLWNDAAAMMVIVLGVPAMVVLAQHLSYSGNRWARFYTGCVLYMSVVFRICYGEYYTAFATIPWLRYADILIPVLVAMWIAAYFNQYKESQFEGHSEESSQHFFYDDMEEVDFLGRKKLVEDLCQRLAETERNSKSATGIAITGGWGTGKSWVLEHIKANLKAKGEICIDFKPWLYGEVDMARMFYKSLESQLKANGLHIEELKKAVTEIDNDEMVGFGRAFLSLFGVITRGGGREQTVEDIKSRLNEQNRPIYVFIDDCDRLAKKELLQVLSLIRNTGDFPGLTYVLAFDKDVVKEIIGSEKGLQYVGKMINLSINLPPIADDVIADYLNQAAGEITGSKSDRCKPFSKVEITHYLPTVREAKRYLNLLSTDYKRHQKRFDKYILNVEDYCLVELLKYWQPEVYYALQSSKQDMVGFVKGYWNSPAGLPIKDSYKEGSDLLQLIQTMFKPVSDPRDRYGIIGIANQDYSPLYFEKEPDGKFIDGKEYNLALEKEIIPQKIDEWMSGGYSGVMGLLCAGFHAMSRKDVFLAMSKYIWHKCEGIEGGMTMGELTYGYGKDKQHGFMNIMKVIDETPQIQLLTFQRLTDEDEKEDGVMSLIEESDYPLELMGIWMNQLNDVKHTDYPYGEVTFYIEKLWDRLLKKVKNEDGGTLDMIDILATCTLEPTFSKMAMPLVKDNPQRWLGATVMILHDSGKEYYLLKSRAIHALFGSLEKMYDEMKIIVNTAKDENKAYVEAYQDLIYRLAAIMVNKKDDAIPDKYKEPESIEVDKYPDLAASELLGNGPVMPLADALAQIKETDFWKGKDLRIHREDPGFYFGMEL